MDFEETDSLLHTLWSFETSQGLEAAHGGAERNENKLVFLD